MKYTYIIFKVIRFFSIIRRSTSTIKYSSATWLIAACGTNEENKCRALIVFRSNCVVCVFMFVITVSHSLTKLVLPQISLADVQKGKHARILTSKMYSRSKMHRRIKNNRVSTKSTLSASRVVW